MSVSAELREVIYHLGPSANGGRGHRRDPIEAELARLGRLEIGSVSERLRFVDTFDRRLERAGLELRLWGRGKQVVWELVEPDGGSRSQLLSAQIAFAADLPAGPQRERLAPLLHPRRLLVLADVVVEGHKFSVVTADGETLLAGAIESYTSQGGSLIGPVVRLDPRRGHRKVLESALGRLQPHLGESVGSGRHALLVQPEPSPPTPQLDPSTPLAVAVRTTLAPQLWTFERNLEGSRRNLDPEFLHDLRVATRRSRALLGEVRRELADPEAEHLRSELRRVANATNAARDLDVLILDLTHDVELGEAAEELGLEAIRSQLIADRNTEARRVRRRLSAPSTRALVAHWHTFVERAASGSSHPTIGEVAAKRLRKRARRLIDDARRADPATRPTDLHELRLLGKKVRYLLEAWGALVLDDPGAVVRVLKGVQDRLGELNDLAVQQRHLRELAGRISGHDQKAALLALGAWLERLRRRELERRTELLAHRELWLPAIEEVAAACRGSGDQRR